MPKLENISKKLIIGLTGKTAIQVINKIKDADKFNIEEAGLFLEILTLKERKKVYIELEKSKIKKIPLIHIRNDMKKWELKYLEKKYNPTYMTIHESTFKYLKKWKGYYKKLFLEMNYDNKVKNYVNVEKIGGFCIDLSHFKSGEERWAKDFEYVLKNKDKKKLLCNHLNGYLWKKRKDLHRIRNKKDFNYLQTLPEFVFGQKIALEMYNPIKEQIKYKKHLIKMLS